MIFTMAKLWFRNVGMSQFVFEDFWREGYMIWESRASGMRRLNFRLGSLEP